MKFELNQKKSFSAERLFNFKDKNTLLVILKNVKKHKEYLIDIAALDPKSHSHFVFAFKPLISFIFFLNLSLIFHLTSVLDFLTPMQQEWALSSAIIFTLLSFILFIIFTRHERVFVSRESKVPLVYFYNGLPNKKEFKHFMQYIAQQSQQRFEKLALNIQQQRAGEMKTIRRVFDEGIITLSQYENGKEKLLKLSDN